MRYEVARTVVCYRHIINKPAGPFAESIGISATGVELEAAKTLHLLQRDGDAVNSGAGAKDGEAGEPHDQQSSQRKNKLTGTPQSFQPWLFHRMVAVKAPLSNSSVGYNSVTP